MKNILKISIVLVVLGGFGACSSKREHKISKIDEASGISYCKNSDTLFVVGDEGDIYEINKSGKILSKHHLGDFDLEGVVCEDSKVVLAEESGYILLVDRKNFRFDKIKISSKGFKFSKKSGIEGIAKLEDGKFILAIQSKKRKKAKLLVVEIKGKRAKIKEIIDSGIIDSAGVERRDNLLYITSDKKDKLYIFDLKEKKVIEKIKLPKFAQEGITFDNEGFVYLADDDGAVFKYSPKELSLEIK